MFPMMYYACRFNWGLTVQRKGERVVKLIEDFSFRNEERARARKLMSGIKGFGSFCGRVVAPAEGTVEDGTSEKYVRCNSHFNDYPSGRDDGVLIFKEDEFKNIVPEKIEEEDHPFYDDKENQALVSLLSS